MTVKITTKNGTIIYNHFNNVTLNEIKKEWIGKLVNFYGLWLEVTNVEKV